MRSHFSLRSLSSLKGGKSPHATTQYCATPNPVALPAPSTLSGINFTKQLHDYEVVVGKVVQSPSVPPLNIEDHTVRTEASSSATNGVAFHVVRTVRLEPCLG